MKRPAFQFYPDNWRNNSNLRRCSWAARGAWVEVMCLMHDADEYGALPWSLKEIAQALGCPLSLLRELATKGVMKGCDEGECEAYIYTPRSGRKVGAPVTLIATRAGPFWYSSRMVRDEYVRGIRGENTRFSAPDCGQDDAPMPSPMPPFGEAFGATPKPTPTQRQSDGPPTPSPTTYRIIPFGNNSHARKPRLTQPEPAGFAEFWSYYPAKVGKAAARKAWPKAVQQAGSPEELVIALKARLHLFPDEAQYIPNPATWLNQGRWEDDPETLFARNQRSA